MLKNIKKKEIFITIASFVNMTGKYVALTCQLKV
jgi:hypothetical protein